jgi:hypothetical protein
VCEKCIQICGKKLNGKRTRVKARLYETEIGKGIKEKEVNASEVD